MNKKRSFIMLVLALALFVAAAEARRRHRRDRNDWDFGYERDIVKGLYDPYSAKYYRRKPLEKAERMKRAKARLISEIQKELQRQIDELTRRRP